MTEGYKGLQWVTRGLRGLQGLQWVTTGDRGYKGLQGVTGGYNRLQAVTKDYRNFF